MEADRLQYFRVRLLEEKRKFEAELAESNSFNLNESLTDSVKELSGYDNHPADLGSETFEREKDLSLKMSVNELRQRVDAALERIDKGVYGICEACGREIASDRLEALPYTALCINCQHETESRRRRRDRPVEEEILTHPFGRTFLDGTANVGIDGEDVWQSVARYGTSETPSDLGGALDYENMFVDAGESQGAVQKVEKVIATDPDDIPPDPEDDPQTR